MACCLFGTQPLSKPLITTCEMDLSVSETNSSQTQFDSNTEIFNQENA